MVTSKFLPRRTARARHRAVAGYGCGGARGGAAATCSQNQISVSTNAARIGGTFIVLNNVNTFQVVVPFEESDAAKVQPNQPVEVTFDHGGDPRPVDEAGVVELPRASGEPPIDLHNPFGWCRGENL